MKKQGINLIIIIGLISIIKITMAHPLTIMAYNINYTHLENTEVHVRLTGGPPTEIIMPELEQQWDNFQMAIDGKPCSPLRREGTIFFFFCSPGAELVVTDTMNYSLVNQTVIVGSTLFFTTFQGKIGDVLDGAQRNVFPLPQELAQQQTSLQENPTSIPKKDHQKSVLEYVPKIAGAAAAIIFIAIMIYFFRRSRREKNYGQEIFSK